jgi:hypothetical protein
MNREALKKKIQGIRTFKGKILQPWQKRAMDNPQLHTKKNESVQTASMKHKGKELLFPRVRMRGPGLEKMSVKKAFKEALKRKDFLTFDSPKQATKYSKEFSNELGRRKR